VTSLLLECGASIDEINVIRKHISRLKGGQLARLVAPATLITLVLSDVVGDRLDVIASGPTVPDPTTYQDCLEIIRRYNLLARLPASVRSHLQRGQAGELSETPKAIDPAFAGCQTVVIGSNRLALQAARAAAQQVGVADAGAIPRGRVRHVFTHRDLTAEVFLVSERAGTSARDDAPTVGHDQRWVGARDLGEIGISSFTRKTLAAAGVGGRKRDGSRNSA